MKRKLNLRSEKKWMMFFDFFTVAGVNAVLSILLANEISVGIRAYAASAVLFAVCVFSFMIALDEYKIYVSQMYEKTVIFILSSLYSYVIVALSDLILLRNSRMAVIHIIYAVVMVIALFVENFCAEKISRNPKFFEKPKLLIIETDEDNIKRMKRMKYGSLKYYDSWYETLDPDNEESVKELIEEKVVHFDAICLLDRVKDSLYNKVVRAAIENNKDLYIAPKLNDIGRNNSKLTQFDDVVAMYIPRYTMGTANEFLKRGTDLVLGSIAMIIAVIPMAIIALAIKLTSPGPVFYKQVRLTKNKKEFEIYKFRTMVQDAEKLSGPVLAKKDDDRITPIGKILRACRLDELPQIINILKGDMSIVGPRPERPFFVEQFEKEIDSYKFRFAVKAGLTGLSHVYGRYSTYTYDRTCFDLVYITNYSYLLDLKIMLLTSKIMFLKSAAEGEDEYKLAPKDNKKREEMTVK